jgi:hypothetical protein
LDFMPAAIFDFDTTDIIAKLLPCYQQKVIKKTIQTRADIQMR